MRKLFTLGLLALSSGFLTNTAFAGNVEECEPLKQSGQKNLYGLCVAWHNADESAKDALATKFLERAGYRVPGSGAPDPDPDPSEDQFSCPCWDEMYFADICPLGMPISYYLPPGSLVGDVIFGDFINFTAEGFGSEGTGGLCGHFLQNLFENEPISLDNNNEIKLTEAQAIDCRVELEIIAGLYADPLCNPVP